MPVAIPPDVWLPVELVCGVWEEERRKARCVHVSVSVSLPVAAS